MQAIIQTRYGAPDVLRLESLPTPTPAPDEVRVRIIAAPVTAADSMMRQGVPRYGRLFLGLRKPRHPVSGTGFSGIVDAVGSAATMFAVGDEVMGESILGAGTHCSHVCVPQHGVLINKPAGLTHAQASAVCDGPLTAWNFLHRIGHIQPGQQVLINGAAGSLGSAAVQLAKLAGASVTGVCSTRNIALVEALGADHVIDYTLVDPLASTARYDLVFDSVGKFEPSRALNTLRNNGSYQSPVLGLPLLIRMLSSRLRGHKRVHFSATGLLPQEERLAMLIALQARLSDGQLQMHIDRQYSLADIASAHDYVDTGHKRGTVVVLI